MVYIGKRQSDDDTVDYHDDDYHDDYHHSWWYSDTADAIKWAVVAAIFFAMFLFLAIGYIHARRRIRRGQPPLRYHRRLSVPRQDFSFYQHRQNPYEMNPYPVPPPGMALFSDVYQISINNVAYRNNEGPPPPRYEPPQGASKMNPNQGAFAPAPLQAGEASNAGSASAAPGHRQFPDERFDAVPLQSNEAQPPPQSSGRSWNPLKRFK
ncbi:MAG: hypothetical protein Q9178_005481 [Gyalolechia marmorata]